MQGNNPYRTGKDSDIIVKIHAHSARGFDLPPKGVLDTMALNLILTTLRCRLFLILIKLY